MGEDTIFSYELVLKNPQMKIIVLDEELYNYSSSDTSAGNKGIISYYDIGNWCFDHWKKNVSLIENVVLEGYKEHLLFRQEGTMYPNELRLCKKILYKNQWLLLKERRISMKYRILYCVLVAFPFVYRYLVYRSAFHKRI